MRNLEIKGSQHMSAAEHLAGAQTKTRSPAFVLGSDCTHLESLKHQFYTDGLRSHCCRSFLTSKSLFNSSPRTFPFKLIQ